MGYTTMRDSTEPAQTMAFLNYYPAADSGPNPADTLAVLLTAPSNGRRYGLDDPFVDRELRRVWDTAGLPGRFETSVEECTILDPHYFSLAGGFGGALYGAVRPLAMSGPLHRPAHHSLRRPWLWRVGASVHPGGGLPAVMGGAMMTMDGLLRALPPGHGGRGFHRGMHSPVPVRCGRLPAWRLQRATTTSSSSVRPDLSGNSSLGTSRTTLHRTCEWDSRGGRG
ncbi:hypothetical protein BCL67_1182 [Nesterenkonia sandarakina]|uniref:Phytoene desaturase n=1 Tax=Nesterenkonia sandarakina TaxID=272918 RepID=A0A2T0YD57_9MICC|nr:hypothetical protein BCL67_1182 [Nesterenkonia sandarakina]